MEYLESCSTTIRRVARKVGLYVFGDDFTVGCNFQTGGLAYDNYIIHKKI